MAVDYTKVINDSREELRELVKQRDAIDARISQVVIALRALARLQPGLMAKKEIFNEISNSRRKEPTLMEAISSVLREAGEYITGAQVRELLEDSGFDLSEYSQPMGTILTTLNRLAESRRAKRGLSRDKTATYKWVEGSTPMDSVEEARISPPKKKLPFLGD